MSSAFNRVLARVTRNEDAVNTTTVELKADEAVVPANYIIPMGERVSDNVIQFEKGKYPDWVANGLKHAPAVMSSRPEFFVADLGAAEYALMCETGGFANGGVITSAEPVIVGESTSIAAINHDFIEATEPVPDLHSFVGAEYIQDLVEEVLAEPDTRVLHFDAPYVDPDDFPPLVDPDVIIAGEQPCCGFVGEGHQPWCHDEIQSPTTPPLGVAQHERNMAIELGISVHAFRYFTAEIAASRMHVMRELVESVMDAAKATIRESQK